MRFTNCLIISISLCFASCSPDTGDKKQITVFCASSLEPVMLRLKAEWESTHRVNILLNSASSGTLTRQIEHGAPADIFLSANSSWMRYLSKEMTLKNAPKSMAHNRLAIVAARTAAQDSGSFKQVLGRIMHSPERIATGDPSHVPLGKYAREFMDFYHIFGSLSPRLLLTKDARSALRLSEMGEAGFGVVYYSDARSSARVKILSIIPEACHSGIVYEGIALSSEDRQVMDFYLFLSSATATDILTEYGFSQ